MVSIVDYSFALLNVSVNRLGFLLEVKNFLTNFSVLSFMRSCKQTIVMKVLKGKSCIKTTFENTMTQ